MSRTTTTPSMTSSNTETKAATDCKKFLEKLQLVIDGQADEEDKRYFDEHIHDCIDCANFSEVEKAIKDAIQLKVHKKPVPSGLMESIKSKILNGDS